MAYDTNLAQRIRQILDTQPYMTERKMFGGISFLVQGNIACGILGDELMVRVGPEEQSSVLKEPDVRIFDLTGRPSKSIVMVSAPAFNSRAELRKWVKRGVDFALTLPAKK
jgi:TfoX/Sxy family transcriptional regulator of competence genes